MILCERPSVFQGGAFNRASHKRRWKLDVEEADDSDGCTRPRGPHNGSPQPRFCKLPANITILALLRAALIFLFNSLSYLTLLFTH